MSNPDLSELFSQDNQRSLVDQIPRFLLEDIYAPIQGMLEAVDNELAAIGKRMSRRMSQIHAHVFDEGGKRLRPSLAIFGASFGNTVAPEKVVALAMATELIHTATLVHDDLIDQAILRRKKQATHVKFGDDVALLAGDFLYSYAFTIVTPLENPLVLDILARSTRVMSEGELNQLEHRYDFELSLEKYLSFIEAKTASLIAASGEAGARLAKAPRSVELAMRDYGINLGMAFQITDDLLDLVGDEYSVGKTLRTDIVNGKITLPLILLRDQLGGNERRMMLNLLHEPESGWPKIRAMMAASDVAEQSRRIAQDYCLTATLAVKTLPDHSLKANLVALARFILERKH